MVGDDLVGTPSSRRELDKYRRDSAEGQGVWTALLCMGDGAAPRHFLF